MISYELAKELRNAGFAYDQDMNMPGEQASPTGLGTWLYGPTGVRGDDTCYCPTLSELIEACQVHCDHFVLECKSGCVDFETGATDIKFYQALYRADGVFQVFNGDTPSEAVAKLWLALHNK